MIFLNCFFIFLCSETHAQIPTFPGVEGFGANTSGGHGGRISIVDKLTDVHYNLVYNFGENSIQFAWGALVNIVGNILRFGPQTTAQKAMEAVDRDSSGTLVYLYEDIPEAMIDFAFEVYHRLGYSIFF